mmetsp:Transcript_5148/g.16561  ORF Transcript_5148/g.16561 Transcript_5148/m.16561 type:complete len:206 (+) Transcript_5148:464-1081(+)
MAWANVSMCTWRSGMAAVASSMDQSVMGARRLRNSDRSRVAPPPAAPMADESGHTSDSRSARSNSSHGTESRISLVSARDADDERSCGPVRMAVAESVSMASPLPPSEDSEANESRQKSEPSSSSMIASMRQSVSWDATTVAGGRTAGAASQQATMSEASRRGAVGGIGGRSPRLQTAALNLPRSRWCEKGACLVNSCHKMMPNA